MIVASNLVSVTTAMSTLWCVTVWTNSPNLFAKLKALVTRRRSDWVEEVGGAVGVTL